MSVPRKLTFQSRNAQNLEELEVGFMAKRTFRLRVGEKIRDLRKKKRVRQDELARMVGISPGAVSNFEKGRRSVSLDWLRRIADALDTPIAYFLPDGEKKIGGGDPREKRLLAAWRLLGTNAVLRRDFLSLMEHLGARPAEGSLASRFFVRLEKLASGHTLPPPALGGIPPVPVPSINSIMRFRTTPRPSRSDTGDREMQTHDS